jgi:hypothetical protein
MYVMVTDRPLDEIFGLALMKIDMLFHLECHHTVFISLLCLVT